MKVLGTNIYGGGFGHGVRNAGANFIGTVETWKPGIALANELEIRQLLGIPTADMVIMNPPCSRFSSMAMEHFSHEEKHNLGSFKELQEGIELSKTAQASIVWWENGPMAFTQGRDIIQQVHKELGAKKTLVMKLDPTYIGLVQLRPRTHVIHFMDDVKIDRLPDRFAAQKNVYDWISSRLEHIQHEPAPDTRYYSADDPVSVVEDFKGRKCFNSCKPALINEHQRYSFAVLSSRQFAWELHNRWWSIPEYAAAMTYPVDIDYASMGSSAGLPLHKIMPLLSKSVMPAVAEYVYSNIVLPTANNRTVAGSMFAKEEYPGVYFARMMANHHARDPFELL